MGEGGSHSGWDRPGDPSGSVEGPEGEQGRLLRHEDEAEDGADVLGGHRLDGEVAQDLVGDKTLGQAKTLSQAETLGQAKTLGQAETLGQAKMLDQVKVSLGDIKMSLGQAKPLG